MLQTIADLVAAPLQQVEARFEAELSSDLPAVAGLVKHVARFRGKMLRPTLLLLAAKAVGQLGDAHITLATVVEMVHMATLVHDDVLDDAELRRRGATINHLRGNEAAVILGDYLISHSYHLCSSLQSQHASRAIAAATNRICEGELLQLDNRRNLELTEETYFTIIARKTAELTAVSCALGARYAGATEPTIAALHHYGLSLGIAFQVQDDILDLVGNAREVGKTLGLDIEKTKLTLPLIHFLRTAPIEHRRLLRSLLTGTDPDRAEQIRNLILPSGALDYARHTAAEHVASARQALEILPPSDARTALDAAAQLVIERSM